MGDIPLEIKPIISSPGSIVKENREKCSEKAPGPHGGPGAWEETRWAEQADRVFRRDSRRYDGGFYLY